MNRHVDDIHQNHVEAAILVIILAGAGVLMLFYPEKLQAWTLENNDRYPFPGLLRSGCMAFYFRMIGLFLLLMDMLLIYSLVRPA